MRLKRQATHFRPGLNGAFAAGLTVVVVVAATTGYRVLALSRVTGVNVWDAVLPAITESLLTVVFLGLIWVVYVVTSTHALVRLEVMMRHGSRAEVSIQAITRAGVAAVALIAVSVLVSLLVAAPLGLSLGWSAASTVGALRDSSSVYAAAALAKMFPSPLAAVAATQCFFILCLVSIAAIYVALAIRGHSRWARRVLLIGYLWAAVSSFGVAAALPALDAVRYINLPWAIASGTAVPAAVGWLMVLASAVMAARTRSVARVPVDWYRWLLGGVVVVGALLVLGESSKTGEERWEAYFLSSSGSIIDFARVALVVLGVSTALVARLDGLVEGRYVLEVTRFGSQRTWVLRRTFPVVRDAILAGVGWVALAAGLLALSSNAPGLGTIVATSGLAALQILALTSIGVVLCLYRLLMPYWPVFIGLYFLLGYPFIIRLDQNNPFDIISYSVSFNSSYALRPGVLIAGAIAVVAAIWLAVQSRRARLPLAD